jgi:hypothetical protein
VRLGDWAHGALVALLSAALAFFLLALVATLLGCGGYEQIPNTPQRTAFEQRALAVAQVGLWEAKLGPLARCRGDLTLLQWETGTDEDVQALCVTSKSISACFNYVADVPVIMLAERPRTDQQLLITRLHELQHWLLRCSGVDESGDLEHAREAVWRGLL